MIPEGSVRVTVVLKRDQVKALQDVYRAEEGDYRGAAAATAVAYAAKSMILARQKENMLRGIITDYLDELETQRVNQANARGAATTFVAAERADAAENAYDVARSILRAVLG